MILLHINKLGMMIAECEPNDLSIDELSQYITMTLGKNTYTGLYTHG